MLIIIIKFKITKGSKHLTLHITTIYHNWFHLLQYVKITDIQKTFAGFSNFSCFFTGESMAGI